MTAALEVIETGEVVQPMTAEEASSVTTQITVKLDAIADNYESVMPLIRDAITRQAHVALGYRSAGEYAADRFGRALSRLGVDTRRAVVKELSEAGLSTRAIAPIVGVTQKTIVKDRQALAGDTEVSPDPEPTADTVDMGEGAPLGPDLESGEYSDLASIVDDLEEDDEPALTDEECRALADPDDLDEEPEPARITGTDGRRYPASRPKRKPNRSPLPDAARDAGWELRKAVERIERLINDDRFTRNREEVAAQLRGHLTYTVESCQGFLDQLPSA